MLTQTLKTRIALHFAHDYVELRKRIDYVCDCLCITIIHVRSVCQVIVIAIIFWYRFSVHFVIVFITAFWDPFTLRSRDAVYGKTCTDSIKWFWTVSWISFRFVGLIERVRCPLCAMCACVSIPCILGDVSAQEWNWKRYLSIVQKIITSEIS